MSAAKVVTDAGFEADVLRNPKPVIVEYWAQWCGPCHQVSPVLEAIAAEHGDKLDVVKLNVDENPETARRYAIMLVPTLNLFCGGEVVKQVVGARSRSALMREFADFLQPANSASKGDGGRPPGLPPSLRSSYSGQPTL